MGNPARQDIYLAVSFAVFSGPDAEVGEFLWMESSSDAMYEVPCAFRLQFPNYTPLLLPFL